jgi:DNA polymerase-1
MWKPSGPIEPAAVAARGRYARNAVVQGSAAELFKMWAVTVRAGLAGTGGEIVLCLHDELLLHVPESQATEATALLRTSLAHSAATWAAGSSVRFVVDIAVVRRWSDAKDAPGSAGIVAPTGLAGDPVVRNAR